MVSGQDVKMKLPFSSSLLSNDLYSNRMEFMEMGNHVLCSHLQKAVPVLAEIRV